MSTTERCPWCQNYGPFVSYHDEEWGVPVHDDRHLFEMLTLEGAQAGLNWLTVLKRRTAYRAAFDQFDVGKIARYDEQRIEELVTNPAIIRHRLKIISVVKNARAFLKIQEDFGRFDLFLWQFVDGEPVTNHFTQPSAVPTSTRESDQLSKALKERGFSFVGTTICYAYMQGVGLVNDHLTSCFRWSEIQQLGR